MDVLANNGDNLHFESLDSFHEQIKSIDTSVPPAGRERKSFHRERASIVLWMKAMVNHSQLEFPFTMVKSESPDFILTMANGIRIGIEHRDITTEKYQEHLSLSGKSESTSVVFLDQFKLGGPPKNEINSGWVGDEVEKEWATLADNAILDKTDLLNKEHYQKLDSYELLLYSNTHLPNIDREKAIALLFKNIGKSFSETSHKRFFHHISFIYGIEVWLHQLTIRN